MAYAADTPARISARPEAKYFYFYLALSSIAVAFLGFTPTYWMPVAAGTFKANPVVHIHGMIFFSWTIYYAYQTWLAASGQVARHRTVGLIGVSLATAMTIFGFLVAIASARNSAAQGLGEPAKAFMIVPILGIIFFAASVILALVNIRRPQWHKRLLLLATVAILPAAVARWFIAFLPSAGFPTPAFDLAPTAISGLLLVVAIIHDWRTRGRPHAVYVVGGGLYVVLHLLQTPITHTPAWQSFAGWLMGLPG